MRATILSAASSAFLSAPGVAATFEEATLGDFRRDLFVLEEGSNTISGSQSFDAEAADTDPFLVRVPAGLRIEAILLSYLEVSPLSGTTALGRGTDLNRCRGASLVACGERIVIGERDPLASSATNILDLADRDAPLILFPDVLPLDLGTYEFGNSILSRSGPGGSWSYSFHIELRESAVVPVPATWPMMAVVLFAGLGVSRRRGSAPGG